MKTRTLAILNTVAFGFHVLLAYLAQTKRLSSSDVGEISAEYNSVFSPAGLTFAIWGLIYFSLTAFCVYHLLKAFRNDPAHQANYDTKSIGWLFIINNLATGFWLMAWVNEKLLVSVGLILVQLISLILISIRAHISNPDRHIFSKLFTQFPLSIYFGWISVATIANISAYLVSVNRTGFGIEENYWAIILIGAVALISLFIILVRRDFFFGLVVLWALYGILLKRQDVDEIQFANVINAARAAFIVVLIALAIRLFNKQSSWPGAKPERS